jgi:hypothetical protein
MALLLLQMYPPTLGKSKFSLAWSEMLRYNSENAEIFGSSKGIFWDTETKFFKTHVKVKNGIPTPSRTLEFIRDIKGLRFQEFMK